MRFSLSPWKKELIYMREEKREYGAERARERNFYLCIARKGPLSIIIMPQPLP